MRVLLAALAVVAMAPRAPAQFCPGGVCPPQRGFALNLSVGRQYAPAWSAPWSQPTYAPPVVYESFARSGCTGSFGAPQFYNPYAPAPPFQFNQYNGNGYNYAPPGFGYSAPPVQPFVSGYPFR